MTFLPQYVGMGSPFDMGFVAVISPIIFHIPLTGHFLPDAAVSGSAGILIIF